MTGLGGLAGCAGQGESSEEPTRTTTTIRTTTADSSVVQGTSFEGTDLVVELRDGHGVSKFNLIAPDGRYFSSAHVATGATTVHIPVLRIETGSLFKHYAPGTHELVAVGDRDRIESISLDLYPDLNITDIRQYQEGSSESDYGRLVVTIENTGTAPTWIYDIAYEGAPNYAANDGLSSFPGIPSFRTPKSEPATVIHPNGEQKFVGHDFPIVFYDERQGGCQDQQYEFSLTAAVATESHLDATVRVTTGEPVVSAGIREQYTCRNYSTEIIETSDKGGSS